MKKQFSPRRNYNGNSSRGHLWTFGFVFVFVLLCILLRSFVPNVFIAVSTPLWNGGTKMEAGVGNAFSGLANSQKLVQENESLTQEVHTLQNENVVLTTRAQDLTKLLGGQADSSSNILAGVVARPPLSPYDTIIVGTGKKEGVVAGSSVLAAGGIPIGTVQSVTTDSAIIALFSTPKRTTSGWVGSARIPLVLVGEGAGAFTATLPKATPISVGDIAYVPGPGAIPLGTVVRIDVDPSSPTVVLYIQPLINIFSLTWVEINRSSQ